MNQTKPRILFVLHQVLGFKTYAAQIERVLAQRDDIEYEILTLRPDSRFRHVMKRHNVGRLGRWLRFIDPIQAYQSGLGQDIRRVSQQFKPDLVHFSPHLPAGAIAFCQQVPFTVTMDATRACMERAFSKRVWSSRDFDLEARLLRAAKKLFPTSNWVADSLVRDCGVDTARIQIFPPSTIVPAVCSSITKRSGKPRVIFIGNDFLRKGGDRVVKWVNGPLADICELHIVSKDRAAPTTAGNVYNHGAVPNDQLTADLLPKMDLLCHPTRSDMSAFVVAEASAAGLPSIASAIGGIPDLINHEVSGLLIEPDDDASFISGLRRLIHDQEQRQRMGIAAHEFARKHLDYLANYNGLIDQLKRIAEGNRVSSELMPV